MEHKSTLLEFIYTKWMAFLPWLKASFSFAIFNKIYSWISRAWTNSVFVTLFVTQRKDDEAIKRSIIYKIFYLPFAFLGLFASASFKAMFDRIRNTFIYKWLRCSSDNLIALNTRFLGMFIIASLPVYIIFGSVKSVAILLTLFIVGVVLTLQPFSVTEALGYSIIRPFIKETFDIQPTFKYSDEKNLNGKFMIICAVVTGVISAIAGVFASGFVSAMVSFIPQDLCAVAGSIAVAGAIVLMFRVELTVALTIFAIPFIPTMACAGLVIVCFGLLILKKSANGDKIWRLDGMGIALILFLIIYFICSLTSYARTNSIQIFMLYFVLMSFYFVIINTIKTKKQLYAMLTVFVISGFFVALYGIIQYVFGLDMDKQVWMDEEMFSDIKMRAFSTLENPNVLGEYLLLVLPVSIAFMWSKKNLYTKMTYTVFSAVLLLCLILTMSRGCWVGLLLAAAIFITFVDGRYWVLGIIGLFALPFVLPQSILNRFFSIGDLSDSSSSYRLFIWLGTIKMLKDFWIAGVGPGTQAYNAVYPHYSYSAIVAPHSHNVYLQIMSETGIAGLGVFAGLCITFFRKISIFAKTAQRKSFERTMAVSIAAGIAAFLLQGMFDYVFYNYRVFLMFWMTLALAMCIIYTNKEVSANDKSN